MKCFGIRIQHVMNIHIKLEVHVTIAVVVNDTSRERRKHYVDEILCKVNDVGIAKQCNMLIWDNVLYNTIT